MASQVAPAAGGSPPGFVQLLAHPVRWRLLGVLGDGDRAVTELTHLVGERQSLVSYHLRRLRDDGVVTARQSSADGRDRYYAIDLTRCEEQLRAAGGALHPGLALGAGPPAEVRAGRRAPRVLFLCTGNSARSQIAEALLVRMSDGRVEAASAGSAPKPLHPNAVRVMRAHGIDITSNRTKHLDELVRTRFDAVVTLCDRVREVCPEFPRRPRAIHWSIADPALAGTTNRASYPAFERTADELRTRIRFLLHQLSQSPTTGRPGDAHR